MPYVGENEDRISALGMVTVTAGKFCAFPVKD